MRKLLAAGRKDLSRVRDDYTQKASHNVTAGVVAEEDVGRHFAAHQHIVHSHGQMPKLVGKFSTHREFEVWGWRVGLMTLCEGVVWRIIVRAASNPKTSP